MQPVTLLAPPDDDHFANSSSTAANESSTTTDKSGALSKNFLTKMREVGSAALALTKLQKVNPSLTIDTLRERGVDVALLDKYVERILRFLNKARGKLMLRTLRKGWRERDPRKLIAEFGRLSSEVHRAFEIGMCGCGVTVSTRTKPFPAQSMLLLTSTHLWIDVPNEPELDLAFHDIQAIDATPQLATFTFDKGQSRGAVVSITIANATILTAILAQVGERFRLGTQLVSKVLRKTFHIVHFNDVYHLQPFKHTSGPGVVGGASRFLSKLREIQKYKNPLVLFSGDFMSPSLQSVLMRGKHMIDAFNLIGVQFGTFGNHEFDYGMEALQDCVHGQVSGNFVFAGSNTRWIMSNMNGSDGNPVCGAIKHSLITWNGVRIGILGLSENWLPSCNQLHSQEAFYIDVFSEGERLAQQLKAEGAECVIALTHSRIQTDKEMSTRCPSIDLILGGHDHFYKRIPKCRLVKSGEEFEYLTELEVLIEENGSVRTRSEAHPITHDLPLDPAMEMIIERYETRVQQRMGKVIGITTVPLDCTEECCRFKEGILPGFFCDVMVAQTGADFAVLGGAAIAGKAVMPPGDILLGDVFNWFPGDTKVMTVRIPGKTVKKVLDVMVREVPNEAPSFPHPSAELQFTINTMTTPAVVQDILIRGERLDLDRMYTVAVEDFVGLGKAKYKFIPKEGEPLVDEESAEQITYWIINFFEDKKKKKRRSTMSHVAVDGGAGAPSRRGSTAPTSRGVALIANTAMARNALHRKSNASNEFAASGNKGEHPFVKELLQQSLNTKGPVKCPSADALMRIMSEASALGSQANGNLDAVSTAMCYAIQRLVPCSVARLYHHNTTTGMSWCLAPVCEYFTPVRVACHPIKGIYNSCRRSQKFHWTDTPSEDRSYHRPGEGHPRGDRVHNLATFHVVSQDQYSAVAQLVNVAKGELTDEEVVGLHIFLTQVGPLLLLAYQRELREMLEAQQKLVLDSSIELLSNEDINAVKLFDQMAAVTRCCRKIFNSNAELYMLDFGTHEGWTLRRTMTSKKTHEDNVIRIPIDSDVYIKQCVESGLPTLQDPTPIVDMDLPMAGDQSFSVFQREQTKVMAVPIFAPGSDDMLCVLKLLERKGGAVFTPYDEECALNFCAFAAVAIQTGTEVETLRTGVDRSQLKLFPIHDLGRIKWKRGWGSVRSKLKTIISDAFKAKLEEIEFNADSMEILPRVTVN